MVSIVIANRSAGRRNLRRLFILPLVAGSSLVLLTPTVGAFAQQPQPAHKKSFVQRHPTLTSAAAGYAAYKAAKVTGHNRARNGEKKNFAQRHPVITGVAAAAVTHHYIKKHDTRR